jgi:hypothetical protein
VQAERIVLAHAFERPQVRAAIVEIILGVHLEPGDRREARSHLVVVCRTQTDPGACWDRSAWEAL